jgi:aminoglycoside phosphotransferase (APT) family kinase protein
VVEATAYLRPMATDLPSDPSALRAWLLANVDGVPDVPIELELISGGASNVTMAVTMGERELVVRRPPVTAFLPTANDMAREFRFYTALSDTPVPTPEAYAFCDDPSVLGTPFYVMERLHGVVPHEPLLLEGLTPAGGRTICERFVEVLAAIHAVDLQAVGLADIGKPTGYLERQVRRWTEQWRLTKEADPLAVDAAIDELATILGEHLPASPPTTIVHGDYRLGNVMLDAATRTDVVGVFDWEMATIGDPLADLGYTLLYWGATDRPVFHPSQHIADREGFLTGDELAARYAEVSGRTVEHITFYVVLAAFKLSIIGAGNVARMRAAGTEVPTTVATSPLGDWALDLWRSSTA